MPDPLSPDPGDDPKTSPPSQPPSARGIGFATGGFDAVGSGYNYSIPRQNLYETKPRLNFLVALPRMKIDGVEVPAIAEFPLIAKIGQGGMGAVFYALHPRLKSEVAIKILVQNHAPDEDPEDNVARFIREAQAAAAINSPHLVKVTDVNEEKTCGLPYIVMEYVRGVSAEKIKPNAPGGKGLREADVIAIGLAGCRGLAAAHDAGIIHRDVKPGNILVPYFNGTETLDLSASKLADLGLARDERNKKDSLTHGKALGTPGYMPPEQFDGSGKVDFSTDVFAMGATLFNLLTGRAPFLGETFMESLFATASNDRPKLGDLRPDISAELIGIVDKCLNIKQSERFSNGGQLCDTLLALANHSPFDDEEKRKLQEKLKQLEDAHLREKAMLEAENKELRAKTNTPGISPLAPKPVEAPEAPKTLQLNPRTLVMNPDLIQKVPEAKPEAKPEPAPQSAPKPQPAPKWTPLPKLEQKPVPAVPKKMGILFIGMTLLMAAWGAKDIYLGLKYFPKFYKVIFVDYGYFVMGAHFLYNMTFLGMAVVLLLSGTATIVFCAGLLMVKRWARNGIMLRCAGMPLFWLVFNFMLENWLQMSHQHWSPKDQMPIFLWCTLFSLIDILFFCYYIRANVRELFGVQEDVLDVR